MKNIFLKSWFLHKEFTQGEQCAINCCDGCYIDRETEKAYLLRWNTEFGVIKHWVPKSCTVVGVC